MKSRAIELVEVPMERPHGGYHGHETAGGLSERNGKPEPTHERYGGRGNRSRCEPATQIREPKLEDGVTFSERLRTDLDDFYW